jgi:glycerophosphoryl diester phosphodiesterase
VPKLEASASREAFRDAASNRAEWIEVDVRASSDGLLVCVHDPAVATGEIVAATPGIQLLALGAFSFRPSSMISTNSTRPT